MAARPTAPTFTQDSTIDKMFEAYALDAADFVKANFGVDLDWTEGSIKAVEGFAGELHTDLLRDPPPDETVIRVAKMLGSYLASVCRRHHQAEAGLVTMGGSTIPGIQIDSDLMCWPWGRAQNRLRNGAEDNLWHYYLHITKQIKHTPIDLS